MRPKFQKISTNQSVKIKIPIFRNKLFVSIIRSLSVQNFKKSVDSVRKNCLYGANICESNFFCHPRGCLALTRNCGDDGCDVSESADGRQIRKTVLQVAVSASSPLRHENLSSARNIGRILPATPYPMNSELTWRKIRLHLSIRPWSQQSLDIAGMDRLTCFGYMQRSQERPFYFQK